MPPDGTGIARAAYEREERQDLDAPEAPDLPPRISLLGGNGSKQSSHNDVRPPSLLSDQASSRTRTGFGIKQSGSGFRTPASGSGSGSRGTGSPGGGRHCGGFSFHNSHPASKTGTPIVSAQLQIT
jgi:hypothetical protein